MLDILPCSRNSPGIAQARSLGGLQTCIWTWLPNAPSRRRDHAWPLAQSGGRLLPRSAVLVEVSPHLPRLAWVSCQAIAPVPLGSGLLPVRLCVPPCVPPFPCAPAGPAARHVL